MSLGIAFEGAEGIVLAADSRVTLNLHKKIGDEKIVLTSSFDNATKLLRINGQDFVGAVTYGLGALGGKEPRTAHSFMPEFEEAVKSKDDKRLSVLEFSNQLSDFFMQQWTNLMPKDYRGDPLIILVGGYDIGEAYGRVFDIVIPFRPKPEEKYKTLGNFGITYGGQQEIVTRLLGGLDISVGSLIKEYLKLSDDDTQKLIDHLHSKLNIPIPYQFLPLQDCVDLSIFLIRTTMQIQNWLVGIRGVGGFIDVAIITKTDGFQAVQQKTILGELKDLKYYQGGIQ